MIRIAPIAAAALLAATLPSPAAAADTPLPAAVPEAVGMSSERLGRIGAVLKADIEAGRLPGAVVAIARRGKLAYFDAFGFRDKEAGVPMTKDTIFALASMTKPMTSVAIMMLNEEGRLFISDPVGKYLPAIGKMQVGVQKKGADGQVVLETEPPKRG
jgi:CubicO group peptidase (beta-lactamase class C family)